MRSATLVDCDREAGFGGHFFTKSRRYSTTFRVLRHARTDWRRNRPRTADHLDGPTDEADTTVVINSLTYAGIGWHTTGDALLATTAAALAKERRRAAKEALQDIA